MIAEVLYLVDLTCKSCVSAVTHKAEAENHRPNNNSRLKIQRQTPIQFLH